jgi:hypothetical protein
MLLWTKVNPEFPFWTPDRGRSIYIRSIGDVQQRVDSDAKCNTLVRLTSERSDFASLVAAFLFMPIDSPSYRAAASRPSFLRVTM